MDCVNRKSSFTLSHITSFMLPQPKESLFSQIFPDFALQFGAQVTTRYFTKDQAIVQHGDEALSLCCVVQGWVALTRQTPDGKETVVGPCTVGDIFGEAALFARATYPYQAQAVGEQAEIALIPASALRQKTQENPAFSSQVMGMLSTRLSQTQLKLDQMNTMNAAQRLGCFLLHLCGEERVSGNHLLKIPLEKHILAAHLGMKPETFSRSQQQLKSVGVSVSGTEVKVSDVSALRDFVCNSCAESGNCSAEDNAC
jgi:CRP-like cAMP-binding protein